MGSDKQLNLQELTQFALEEAGKADVDDIAALAALSVERMVRFSNNTITVSKTITNISLRAYIGKDKKRIIGSTSNLAQNSIQSFLSDLVDACASLSAASSYTPLPSRPSEYPLGQPLDGKLEDDALDLPGLAKQAIDHGLAAGARRLSGVLRVSHDRELVSTSAGARGETRSNRISINVRAFADRLASGHGLSCSPDLRHFDIEEAGRTAGEYAKRSIGAKSIKDGQYDLVLSPTVAADIFQHVGLFSSAFAVETGTSFLADRIGKRVSTYDLTLRDHGSIRGGLRNRTFDDEGVPTRETTIIEKGVMKSYLHNSSTGKRFKSQTTGNAGLISPQPWNLVVGAGPLTFEEMISQVDRGLFVTNNWYTRFQNLRGGEYSTVPRDATFLIEEGKLKYPVTGIRISDYIPRQLLNIDGLSVERKWIEWWEVNTPTLAPYVLIRRVPITRAIG